MFFTTSHSRGDRWRGVLTIKGKRHFVYAKTQGACWEKLARLRETQERLTVETWLNRWLEGLRKRDTTIAANREAVERIKDDEDEDEDAKDEAENDEDDDAKSRSRNRARARSKASKLDFGADPRDADMPDVDDGGDALNPPDIDADGDFMSNGDIADIDEATQAWLAGDTRKARELGLSESDIESWLHSRTAWPITLSFGQSMQSASVGNAKLQDMYEDAVESVKPKGGDGNKVARPSFRPTR